MATSLGEGKLRVETSKNSAEKDLVSHPARGEREVGKYTD